MPSRVTSRTRRRTGMTGMNMARSPWAYIDASGDCWTWLGGRSPGGYGRSQVGGGRYAHRIVWELLVGPIPPGLTLDHLCRNRACVNPDHLEPVSMRVNVLRGYGSSALRARQTACEHGHALTADNTLTRPNGTRNCRTCRRRVDRVRYARRTGAGLSRT